MYFDKPRKITFPIYKSSEEKRLVVGIVLAPERVDHHGDIYDAETIERAAHNFLKDCREMAHPHTFKNKNIQVVESYIAPVDFELEGRSVKRGMWILVAKVMDDSIWEKIKNKEVKGFSIGADIDFIPIKESTDGKE